MHISELKEGDSIWIRDGKAYFWYTCSFISYDNITKEASGMVNKNNSGTRDKFQIGSTITNTVEYCGLQNGKLFATFAPDGTLWEDDSVLGKKLKHPSFGQISVSRVSSSGEVSLFGSDIKLNHYISLEIHAAHLSRGLHNDNVFEDRSLIRVNMTPNQWAEFVSSFNTTGVPCTLSYTKEFGPIESFPFIDKTTQFDVEMSVILKKAKEQYADQKEKLDKICAKSSITKDDKVTIQDSYRMFSGMLTNHIDFIQRQFQENIDSLMTQADTAVMSKLRSKLEGLGLDWVQEVLDALTSSNKLVMIGDKDNE
jgi:hypothetical protein